MSAYNPPVQDMVFLLTEVLNFQNNAIDSATLEAVLEEAAKLATNVLAPLNAVGDRKGAKLQGDKVTTAPGFKEAYKEYREGGWNAVPFPEDYGGQGLPWAVAFPVQEMWQGANMAFGLCPLLNQGAVEAILAHGTDDQKNLYLPKLISGEWTGTMNLTEPQAGSDLGLLRAKAERQGDGTYKISGQKIFITYGEHDCADNIIHLVLARLPDAPDDVKGISLFVVPKFIDGQRNAVKCIGLEHKLGIHGSPTCTMEFAGAKGFLLGGENEGLKCMFTMMNNARLSVGLQGVAIAERAYQAALAYASDRVQGKDFAKGQRISIRDHADVKRMLLSMRASIEAARALTYEAALALDSGDEEKASLLTPVVKAWGTDMAVEVASTGIQIFGGMGYIEETGAAQYLRDARILPIYEGTNGIQAADFAFRKILKDSGKAAQDYMCDARKNIPKEYDPLFEEPLTLLANVTEKLIKAGAAKKMDAVAASSVPYLKGFAIIAGGALMARAAGKAANGKTDFTREKIKTAVFYMDQVLPLAQAWLNIAAKNF
jgi:alkylation response protein AidB-like acyl-CoA dehydrogenase